MYLIFDEEIDGPCVEFIGAKDKCGYGMQKVGGKVVRTHRLEYEKHHGPIPEGMIVMHKCDNPPCRNIKHLVLGTRDDNNKDRAAKGRSADLRGEQCHASVLTENQVKEIKTALSAPYHGINRDLAAKYSVHFSTISRIRRNDNWAST